MSAHWVALTIVCVALGISLHKNGHDAAAACIFDEIQPEKVPSSKVSYHEDISRRTRRETNSSDEPAETTTYQPIRIVPYFYNIDSELDDVAQQRLRTVVFAAIYRIQNILSVIPVDGNLRLQRSGCQYSLAFGINKGKCSKIHPGYRREICSNFIQIPDDHLSGLYTWNATYPKPVREHIAPGAGVPHADYILYVHAHQSSRCYEQASALLAYAIYCQLDQNDRPIAGYVNFCPGRLKTDNFDQQKFYMTAIHELFHALGFSQKLYSKFRECDAAARDDDSFPACPHRNSLTGKLGGVTRFITPAVVRESQRHFECPREQDFGAPVEIVNGRVGSHWHARFMQGSVMAPSIGETRPAVDLITLAMFEDSGWYRVNYSEADTYTWGQGEGCEFGLERTCQKESLYFCTGSGPGCHFTHVTKGHCDTDSTVAPCRIFMAKLEENCTIALEPPSHLSVTGEVYGSSSRCFLANLTTTDLSKNGDLSESKLTGKCFQYMCPQPNHLLVRTSTTDWQPCPFGEIISVEGYEGHLLCPSEGTLCEEGEFEFTDPFTYTPPLFLPTETSSASTTSSAQTTTCDNMDTTATSEAAYSQNYDSASDVVIPVVVVFPSLDLNDLKRRRLVKGFLSAVLGFVVMATNITESRLMNAAVERGSVRVLFDIKPADRPQEGPSSEETFEILVDCVEHGNWSVKLPTLGTHKASRISKRSQVFPIRAKRPGIKPGVIVGIVLGLIAVLVVLAIIIIFINKYKMTSQRSVTPSPRDASSQEPSIVYTHRPDKRSGQKCSFTNLHTAKNVR